MRIRSRTNEQEQNGNDEEEAVSYAWERARFRWSAVDHVVEWEEKEPSAISIDVYCLFEAVQSVIRVEWSFSDGSTHTSSVCIYIFVIEEALQRDDDKAEAEEEEEEEVVLPFVLARSEFLINNHY